MTTPTSTRSGRVTIHDVAAAGAKTAARVKGRAEHEEAQKGFVSENPDWTHQYVDLDLSELWVDPDLQRPEQVDEINAIARDHNPMALGTFTVSRRVYPGENGEPPRTVYVLVDGQQRRAGSIKAGWSGKVHCDVHDNLTRADEARLFRQLNFRKSVSPTVLFRNSLTEGNPHAHAVQAILDGLGIKAGTAKGYMAVKGAVELVQRNNGVTHLEWALRQTKRLWDRGSGGVYDGPVVRALFLLHERFGNRIDEGRLFDQLANDEESTAGLVEFARTLKRVHKGTMAVAIVRAIIDRYNKGLWSNSRNRLPEWDSTTV